MESRAQRIGRGCGGRELAGQLAEAEAKLLPRLPRQLVHGDFWDNNIGFRVGRLVLVADFDFMGERARIDDVALNFCISPYPTLPGETCRRTRSAVSPAWFPATTRT